MYCPSCGQQQASSETKFCSRCGMPLGVVAEVLSHGGFLPQLAELYKKRKFFTRRNGVAFSLIWCLFFLLVMAPLWGIIGVEELAGASAVIGIFGGLIWLISALVFLPKGSPNIDVSQFQGGRTAGQAFGDNQAHGALPPQQSAPASVYTAPAAGRWRDTNDLQPSVTESTTRLLDSDER